MDCHYVILQADNNFSFFSLAFFLCFKSFQVCLSIIINNTHFASHIMKLIHFTFLPVIFLCELSIRSLCAVKNIFEIIFHFSKTACKNALLWLLHWIRYRLTAWMEKHPFITDFIIRCTYEPPMILKHQISEKLYARSIWMDEKWKKHATRNLINWFGFLRFDFPLFFNWNEFL